LTSRDEIRAASAAKMAEDCARTGEEFCLYSTRTIPLMSNEHKDPDSTTLHLGKFAPAKSPATPESDTGVTVSIKRAAAQTVQHVGQPVVPKDGGALPAEQMLGAVSYCYAKGVYTSEEIERKMLRDPELREAVHGEVPNANAIRRFRRLNRGAIQETLEKAFGLLRRKKKPASPLPGQPANPPATDPSGESTIVFSKREAEERVQQAAFIDNMSKE
jgi:hypothetical protein